MSKAEARKDLKARRQELDEIEVASEVSSDRAQARPPGDSFEVRPKPSKRKKS